MRRRASLLGILWLAWALRVFRLADANIWWDEGLAVWAARQPLIDMIRWTSVDVHPPLYFGLLHFWRIPLGDSEFAVRMLSAVAGVLTVAVVWKLGRVLFPHRPWLADLAALFLALARFPIWWSQETRMYALGGLLFTLSLYLLVRLRQHETWTTRLSYLAVTSAALWTLYLLAFTLVVHTLYWLVTLRHLPWREKARELGRWGLYQGVILASFLPWLVYALPRMRTWSVQTSFAARSFFGLYGTLLLLGQSVHVERFALPLVLFIPALVLGFGVSWHRARAREREAAWLLALAWVIPPLAVWYATEIPRSFGYSPKPEARYLLPFAPPFYLLAAWALFTPWQERFSRTWRRGLSRGLLAVLVGVQVWTLLGYYQARYRRDDYPSLAATLAAHIQPGDGVFLHTDQPWPVFAYHWPHAFAAWPHGQDADEASVAHWLTPVWESHDAVWLVVNEDALRADPQRLVEAWLAQRARAQHTWRFGPKRLVLFARTPARAQHMLALAPDWQPPPPPRPLARAGVQVVGWEQPLHRLRLGDPGLVAVTVARETVQPVSLSLTLGQPPAVLAQTTWEIPPGSGRWRGVAELIPPADAPSGPQPYILTLGDASAVMGWVDLLPLNSSPMPSHPPQHTTHVTFGQPPLVVLEGYDLDGAWCPHGRLTLTLHWRVMGTTDRSYKVFVHLIGRDGRPIAQGDDFPLQGQRPTTTWRPGEVLLDTYTVQAPDQLPVGDYPLRIGLYDPTTGERLGPVRVADGPPQPHDQVELQVLSWSGLLCK